MHIYSHTTTPKYKDQLWSFHVWQTLTLKILTTFMTAFYYRSNTSADSSCSWSWKTTTLQYATLNRVKPAYIDIQQKQYLLLMLHDKVKITVVPSSILQISCTINAMHLFTMEVFIIQRFQWIRKKNRPSCHSHYHSKSWKLNHWCVSRACQF